LALNPLFVNFIARYMVSKKALMLGILKWILPCSKPTWSKDEPIPISTTIELQIWSSFLCNDKWRVVQFKSQLMAQFCMTNLDLMQKYLGVEFKCTTHGLFFHQTSYVWNFFNEFHMVDSTLARVPIHESICIQHDIGIEPINAILLSVEGR